MLRSEAIKAFLLKNSRSDLAELYNKDMEVQVVVAKGLGERTELGDLNGKSWFAWSDGIETWQNFRMPKNAMSEPQGNDYTIKFNLEKHAEGIGMTGWDYANRVSKYVTFDFDAITGHNRGLTDSQLEELTKVITNLDFVSLRRSTSGHGLHIYIHLPDVATANHTEHAALARAILDYMSGLTGYNFNEKVDVCGGNTWVWHRKLDAQRGLTLLKQGRVLETIPPNWRDHLEVVHRVRTKVFSTVEQLASSRQRILLNPSHLSLINYLNDNKFMHWWSQDHHLLVTHTSSLKQAAKALNCLGEFDTLSQGNDPNDVNCFLFPLADGAWVVRRYGQDTPEHISWTKDSKNYSYCYFNKKLSLAEVARTSSAVELENNTYQFANCILATEALSKLGVELKLPVWLSNRPMKIKENKSKLVLSINKLENDINSEMTDWGIERGQFKKVVNCHSELAGEEQSLTDYDDLLRHTINESGEDCGWTLYRNNWCEEPINHIKLLLRAKGISTKDADIIMGSAIARAWVLVNRPFQEEYLGDRQWNKSKARFSIVPSIEGEVLYYPTWQGILDHCGQDLNAHITEDSWCKDNNILTGGEYLKMWFASLIQRPEVPLPYLALFGEQNTGKSTLHEAFCDLLLVGGYAKADMALINQQGFNGELEGAVLALIEETNLMEQRSQGRTAYNRVKDWVTGTQISIHPKGGTPRMVRNYTHWIQCSNDRSYIPTFPGDTRIVVIKVPALTNLIPKRELWKKLTKEAPDFLAGLLALEIPDSRDRLGLPVIRTTHKEEAEYDTMNVAQIFLKENLLYITGSYISSRKLYQAFIEHISPMEAIHWTQNKFARQISKEIIKGRISSEGNQETYYGNVCLQECDPSAEWHQSGIFLKRGV